MNDANTTKNKPSKCEVCGANVQVIGQCTPYYANLDHQRIKELESNLKIAVDVIKEIDQPLCELIIDDANFKASECNYDELLSIVEDNSKRCNKLLSITRQALDQISNRGKTGDARHVKKVDVDPKPYIEHMENANDILTDTDRKSVV